MNKKVVIIIIVSVLLIIALILFHMYQSDMNRMEHGEPVKYGTWGYAYSTLEEVNVEKTNQSKEIQFIKTFFIVSDLNKLDSTGKYKYYVVEQFQKDNPAVVKIDKTDSLKENTNYEITFKGYKSSENVRYTIKDIFDNFEIIDIQETQKQGIEQIQENIETIF